MRKNYMFLCCPFAKSKQHAENIQHAVALSHNASSNWLHTQQPVAPTQAPPRYSFTSDTVAQHVHNIDRDKTRIIVLWLVWRCVSATGCCVTLCKRYGVLCDIVLTRRRVVWRHVSVPACCIALCKCEDVLCDVVLVRRRVVWSISAIACCVKY